MYQKPNVPSVDEVGVKERAERFRARSIKADSKVEGLKRAVAMTDLTTLSGDDTPGRVRRLCRKAIHPLQDDSLDCPSVAAVCVYPSMVKHAQEILDDTSITIASVASYFPSGQASLDERTSDIEAAVDAGADEIDVVLNRDAFLSGGYDRAYRDLQALREACGSAHMKVILEVGELGTYDRVRTASRLAIDAGADFIKTSTGTIKPAASMETTLVIMHAVRDHYFRTGEQVGVKPAGGIRDAKLALRYLVMLNEVLGDEWMTPERFRFGASSLINDLLLQLKKEQTGRYHSERYFSLS